MARKKSLSGFCLAVVVSLFCFTGISAADDSYNTLARELSEISKVITQPKVAILPFTYVDKRKSDGGAIIAERLTTRMVKLKKCKVIERQLLENVLQELHLESSGAVDAETTKKLGKVLGVEAIVTGTLSDLGGGMVEVNARAIQTETAEVMTTASAEVEKTWSDASLAHAAYSASQPAEEGGTREQRTVSYQKPAQPAPAYSPFKNSFIDILVGGGSGNMNLKFQNDSYPIKETEVMLDLNGSGMIDPMVSYRVIEFSDLKTEGYGLPAGLRIGGFGKNFGGALEFSFYTQRVVKQKTQVSLNGGTARDFSIQNNDLMRLDSFGISGDLMFRFSDKMIQPYLGVGLGFAINSFYSPGISGYTGTVFKKPLQDLELGVMFRMPVGVRVAIARGTDLFAEYRMVTNLSSFDRDIKDETDTLSMTTGFFIFGLSGRF